MKKKSTQLGIVTEMPQGSMNQDNFFNFYVGEGLGNKPEAEDNSIAGKQNLYSTNPRLSNNGEVQEVTHMDELNKAFNGIPKEDNKTVIVTDWKGGEETEPTAWNNAQVAPQQSSTALPYTTSGPSTSPTNVPGMAQSDSGICNGFNVNKPTSFTTNKKLQHKPNLEATSAKEGVVGDVHGNVHGKVAPGSFTGTRGTHADIYKFNIAKNAASLMNGITDIDTPSATHNNQSPWRNDGKNMTSYTEEEKKTLKPYIKGQKPLETVIPYQFEERLFKTDEGDMAGGGEVITKDFAILPTNQCLKTDKSKLEGDKGFRDSFNMFFKAKYNTELKK